jgi:hypothetical protein
MMSFLPVIIGYVCIFCFDLALAENVSMPFAFPKTKTYAIDSNNLYYIHFGLQPNE